MKWLMAMLLLLSSFTAGAQSLFFDSAESSANFTPVVPGYSPAFPRDHAAHPGFRLEWWYLTANLTDNRGRQWGLQWTLFRQSLEADADPGGWSSHQMWMAHAAITTPEEHYFEQRFARGGIGQAGVTLGVDGFEAWIDDWSWHSANANMLPATLQFSLSEWDVTMQLQPVGRIVRHGNQGYSQKSAGNQASYYYSMPYIDIAGTVQGDSGRVELSGQAWLDREWSSEPLSEKQTGWDWFSLHLDEGEKLMLYRLRQNDGQHWLSGTWIDSHGEQRHLDPEQVALLEKADRTLHVDGRQPVTLPLEWQINIPALDIQLEISPLLDGQWMATAIAYWEGVVIARDKHGQPRGRGYMELTGYD